jgi:hypothetical protein
MSKTGYVYIRERQSQAELENLFGATFGDGQAAWIFSGEMRRYIYAARVKPDFTASHSGVAFNAEAELRWEQNQPNSFKVVLLSENRARLPDADPQEFAVTSGRNTDNAGLIAYGKRDKRLPSPPVGDTPAYLYYKDTTTGQIRFMRLVAS